MIICNEFVEEAQQFNFEDFDLLDRVISKKRLLLKIPKIQTMRSKGNRLLKNEGDG